LVLRVEFFLANKTKNMAITKDKKKEILDKVSEIADAESIVFANFHGLSGNETVEMRKKLREAGVKYFVARKTLVKKAFDESKIEGDLPELEGELAIAYSNDDVTAPAREIFAVQKAHEDAMSILGGVFESHFIDKAKAEEIALIPSHDTLKGMFVNVINAPLQGFVMTLKAIADKQEA
jgi:large subunit ribosomal protein L10